MALFARVTRAYIRGTARLPWWVMALIGAVTLVLGVLLTVQPFMSLTAIVILLSIALIFAGVVELVRPERPRTAVILGPVWIAAGLLVGAVPTLTIIGLTVIVSVALFVTGSIGAVRSLRARADGWVAEFMLAIATLMLGVLALIWRDITLFVVAALFGVRLVLFGVDLISAAVRRARGQPSSVRMRRRRSSVGNGAAAAAMIAAAALLMVSVPVTAAPQPDAFYDPPADVPSEPGQLIRAEPFDSSIPEGAAAWRILYTTTVDEGRPAVASGIVVVPKEGTGHSMIAWAHGTTGFANGCAPSMMGDPWLAGGMPDLDRTLAAGWGVVATDYVGLGTAGPHSYLIGQGEGRSVLDSIRAAQQLEEAQLGSEAVIWGHSQGGHAALWAGGLAADYAPELDIVGVAAIAPASNLPAIFEGLEESIFGTVFASFALAAYSAEYEDVDARDYVRPAASVMMDAMYERCLFDPTTIVSVGTSVFSDQPVWSQYPGDGPLGERARQNVPTLPIEVPLLIAQGGDDTVIVPGAQDAYVEDVCESGGAVDYRTYDGRNHLTIVLTESPLVLDLLDWTAARFEGAPAADSCA